MLERDPHSKRFHWFAYMKPRRFQFLLVFLIAALFMTPMIGNDLVARTLAAIISSLAFVQVVVATVPRKRVLLGMGFLAFLTSVYGSLVISVDVPPLNGSICQISARIIAVVFYGIASVVIFKDVIKDGPVDLNKLCGSVCLYLMIATIFGQFYQLCDLIHPGSLNIASEKFKLHGEINAFERANICNYFSFVTLTTLGYGDVEPLSRTTRTLAYAEALLGQIYLAILVARLVGLHIASGGNSASQED